MKNVGAECSVDLTIVVCLWLSLMSDSALKVCQERGTGERGNCCIITRTKAGDRSP